MLPLKKNIFTGFAPNMTKTDVWRACHWLCNPVMWLRWRSGNASIRVESWLQKYFNVHHSYTFDSGRTALYVALQALGVGEGDEVIVQAFTCIVVANAIRWSKATPVYVDIGDDFNMDPKELKKIISPRTKVIIIQHTFGTPAAMNVLLTIAHEYGLHTIEDCAHSLGAVYNEKKTGTMGDIGMFSFGSDKVVSCGRGGALITANEHIAGRIKMLQDQLPPPSISRIFQQLLTFPLFSIGKALYHLGIGKWLLAFAKKTRLMSRMVYPLEKMGKQVRGYPSRLPNVLAHILLDQLNQLDTVNKYRQAIATTYYTYCDQLERLHYLSNKKSLWQPKSELKGSIFLRYPIFVEDVKRLHAVAKKQGILLGDWYDTVIAPKDSNMSITGYKPNSCPRAELAAKHIINLPTHHGIHRDEIERIKKLLNNFVNQ